MLKLKHQYFGYLMRRTDSLEKTLMMGKIEGRRRRGRQRTRWLNDITDSMDMSLSRLEEIAGASLVAQMVKNLPANAGDMGSISGPGRSHMQWNN